MRTVMYKQTIVVVDDDVDMNNALKRLLQAAGYQVDAYPSAEAVIDAGIKEAAACLVLDIHLPGLSGFELWRQLKSDGVSLPVIFITAYDDSGFYAQAKEADAVACITKPFSGDVLLSAISNALNIVQ